MVARGVIEKTEEEYNNVVIRLALKMRREGTIPVGKIVDGSRLYRMPRMFGSVAEALEETAALYRRNYWSHADELVEVWCEKDAVSGFLFDVTKPLGVPLMITRGFSSETVLQALAEEIRRDGRPMTILTVTDLDPSGDAMPADILRRIKFYAPDADIRIHRAAVTREQVHLFNLPTRPTKRNGNRHASRFEGESVEVDALEPSTLKAIVRVEIENRMDEHKLDVIRAAEASERTILQRMATEVSNAR
ncbi:MAG: hypothetical protein ACXIVE_06600 [Salinarimonas sp.]